MALETDYDELEGFAVIGYLHKADNEHEIVMTTNVREHLVKLLKTAIRGVEAE
jgi:hypothetical protein